MDFFFVTHGFELATRGLELVTRGLEHVTRRSDLVTRNLCFIFPLATISYSEPCHIQNPGIFTTQEICQGKLWQIQNAV